MNTQKCYTLEKIQKDLEAFPYDIQMYMYHELNGRKEEALSYLNAVNYEQHRLLCELEAQKIEDSNEKENFLNNSLNSFEAMTIKGEEKE